MKINYRILLINFVIVVLILGSSAFAFYSLLYNVLTSQQSKSLQNSSSSFIFAYRETLQQTDEEFFTILKENSFRSLSQEKLNKIDFLLYSSASNVEYISQSFGKEYVSIPGKDYKIEEFLEKNPQAVIKKHVDEKGNFTYYGRILTDELLSEMTKRIGVEVALISNGTPTEVSNRTSNQEHFHSLTEAYKSLSEETKQGIYSKETLNGDLIASLYNPASDFEITNNLQFLIFSTLKEAAELRTNLQYILIIIGFAGVILSLILTFVFTDKMRKQIFRLNEATEITKKGNFKNRIDIKSKDELGNLADAFNGMLDELEKNQKAKNEYSEFITLINQNASLSEISDAALNKIIQACNFTVGAIYSLTDENEIRLNSYFGWKKESIIAKDSDYFESVIKNKKTLEIIFEENPPKISTGLITFDLKYLLVLPITYHNKVVALLEVGSLTKPSAESREYLSKIQEQLAIGITNATAVVQLEKYVAELKQLNDDYHNQNIQIKEQNETLLELHLQLKDKADELEIQKQKAEEATKLKSQFLASMSHELRTPMNSILGLSELILEDTSLKGKNRERLEVVLSSGKRLLKLINDILDLSKIEAGKMDVFYENVSLEEIISEIEASISPLALQKKIEFKTERDLNTNLIINTDRVKLSQVLINLLGNAIKFTDEGKVEFKISAKEKESLIFSITDSGIGISKEDQALIFEEFRQIDGSTTRKYSGTGLGLTICKKIADLFKGEITLESSVGKGSTFTFTIPLNFVEVINNENHEAAVNVEKLIQNRKNPVLVIDDDPAVRYTIGQYLNSKGYDTVFADNGITGIEEAIKLQPFAITLDVMMPNKDGWKILQELKENPVTKDIPVILLSIIGDKNLGYGLGAFEYFVKPISAEKLLGAFNKLEKLAQKRIEKIVIVDDDAEEFEKFKREFKDEGVQINYIKDSELAFSKILELQPDLIILDLIMPNVDGITLSHKLKSNRETRHIPIIISTAKDITDEEKGSLYDIVENITVKSKGHPLDVLKVVRDRIRQHEVNSAGKNELPLEEVQENIPDEIEEYFESENTDKNYIGKVLIVDDDPHSLFTINEIVKNCSCETIVASNGIECLKILEEHTPDLILLDIMMPQMDGFQAIKKIKENLNWSGIPVFAVTAKAMQDDQEIIYKHGFDDYIPKPVNPSMMVKKINNVFEKIKVK
jgi:signal transduction histidine kinase/CheY-like chemotaxis protein/HAMP domain-containing protein